MSASKYNNSFRFLQTPGEATLLLLFVILFLPSSFMIRHPENRVGFNLSTLMWQVLFFREGYIELRLTPLAIAALQYIFLKYLLVFQIYRYGKGLTTRRRIYILAIMSELQWPLMWELLLVLEGVNILNYPAFLIPIPLALLVCVAIMKPPPKRESEQMWLETDAKS